MSNELLDLMARRELAKFCIRTLESLPDDEPRKFDALKEYHRQFDEIQSRITELNPDDKPEPVVVGLNPATLTGLIP